MAFRVEDLVVSEKNVYVLSGGRQFIADVEKKTNLTNSESSVSKNPWNLYTEDGKILNNLFDSTQFEIRSQVTSGTSNCSKNDANCHEKMYMPNCGKYVGQCQLYGNAYSITERTTETFDADYKIDVTGNTKTYSFDYGFCRYFPASAYKDKYFTYIYPTDIYTPTDGINYIMEYPLNGFYSDFGNDYTNSTPTIFADAITTKYYLDHTFSVNGVSTTDSGIRVRDMRDYLGIGNTGNSIYFTFRNNRYGTYDANGQSFENANENATEYVYKTSDINLLGCMDNLVIYPYSSKGCIFSSSLDSDFTFSESINIFNAIRSAQPKDNSFIVYEKVGDGVTADLDDATATLVYIPKNGTADSYQTYFYGKAVVRHDKAKFIELPTSVIVVGNFSGIINIYSKNHFYKNGIYDERIKPFVKPKVGYPGNEFKNFFDSCSDFSVFYNGNNIIGIKCKYKDGYMAFVSKAFSTEDRDYEIGEYFQPLLCDTDELFEKQFVKAEIAEHDMIRSSLKSKLFEESNKYEIKVGKTLDFKTECISGSINLKSSFTEPISVSATFKTDVTEYNYDSDTLSVHLTGDNSEYSQNTIATSLTFTPVITTTNTIIPQYAISDILFDYSSVSAYDIKKGEYVFVQINGKGLKKIHVDSIMDKRGYSVLSDCGIINNVDIEDAICSDIKIATISHDESTRDTSISMSEYIGSDFKKKYVTVKPAIRATYKKYSNSTLIGYEQSFSVFPLSGRDKVVKEVIYDDTTVNNIEQLPIDNFDFALGQYIPNSMAIPVKTLEIDTSKHDAAISLVHWNDADGIFKTDADYSNSSQSVSGLYLQYNGMCTEVILNGYNDKQSVDGTSNYKDRFVSTISEYPHPCYGSLVTAGTGLGIFDGPLSPNMTVDDIMTINGYVVVKNYEISEVEATPQSKYSEEVIKSGKMHINGVNPFLHGGYVVTNFFRDDNNSTTIKNLYGVEQIVDKNIVLENVGNDNSVKINNYNGLWHIKPTKNIEFYPKSERGKVWKPYYAGKYVDFIKYYNGYYYISLRNTKELNGDTIGYDIIETDDLFDEKKYKSLSTNMVVSAIRFFDDNAVVEYSKIENGKLVKNCLKSFYYGKVDTKFDVTGIPKETQKVRKSEEITNKHALTVETLMASDDVSKYDNVEVVYSLNRFTPVNSHKSNMFAIKIEDLGLDDSPFLSDSQKKSIKTWLKNKVIDIVDEIKPAHTEIFDVFVN